MQINICGMSHNGTYSLNSFQLFRTGRFLYDSVTNAQSLVEEATESKGATLLN